MVLAQVSGGNNQAGQYAAAFTLATPASIVAVSMSLVLFPAMSEAWGRGDSTAHKQQTHKATSTLLFFMVSLFGSAILCGRILVQVVWGSEFDAASNVLPFLLLATLFSTIAVPSVNSLTSRAQRGMKMSAASSLCGMVVGILFWAALAPRFGIIGVAIGYLIGTIFTSAIPVAIVWRTDHHNWTGLAAKLAFAVAMICVGLAASYSIHGGILRDGIITVSFVLIWTFVMREESAITIRRLRNLR